MPEWSGGDSQEATSRLPRERTRVLGRNPAWRTIRDGCPGAPALGSTDRRPPVPGMQRPLPRSRAVSGQAFRALPDRARPGRGRLRRKTCYRPPWQWPFLRHVVARNEVGKGRAARLRADTRRRANGSVRAAFWNGKGGIIPNWGPAVNAGRLPHKRWIWPMPVRCRLPGSGSPRRRDRPPVGASASIGCIHLVFRGARIHAEGWIESGSPMD